MYDELGSQAAMLRLGNLTGNLGVDTDSGLLARVDSSAGRVRSCLGITDRLCRSESERQGMEIL